MIIIRLLLFLLYTGLGRFVSLLNPHETWDLFEFIAKQVDKPHQSLKSRL